MFHPGQTIFPTKSMPKTKAVISACEKSADWPWALEILETQRPGQPLDNNLTCRDVRFLETVEVNATTAIARMAICDFFFVQCDINNDIILDFVQSTMKDLLLLGIALQGVVWGMPEGRSFDCFLVGH